MTPKAPSIVPIVLLVALLLALPATRHAGSNAMTRFATTVRLVEDGTFELGPFGKKTSDVAVKDGGHYLDKAPGVSFLLVPFYALARLFASGFDDSRHLTRLLSLLPLALFAGLFLFRRMSAWGVEDPLLAGTAFLCFTIGTVNWPYFFMFFGHGFACCLVLIGTLLLVDYRAKGGRSFARLSLSGLCFGLSIAVEYPTAILGGVAGLYLLSFERGPKRIGVFVLLGAVLPALVIMAFNRAAFGDPFFFGYMAEKSGFYHEQMSRGFFGIGLPRWSNLWLLLFSPAKGLFFWSPVLLFGAVGAVGMIARRTREGLLLSGMIASYVLLFSGYFEASGGAGLGPRHLVPVVGLLVLSGTWLASKGGPVGKGVLVSLAFFSSLLVAVGVFTEPQMPDRVANPLFEFALPLMRAGLGPGNLFGLPDFSAAVLGLLLTGAAWTALLSPGKEAREKPATFSKKAFSLGLALFFLFFFGLSPFLAKTEPGQLHQVRGNHYSLIGDFGRAAREYEEAFKTRKDPWILHYQIRAYFKDGRLAEAREARSEMLQLFPGFSEKPY